MNGNFGILLVEDAALMRMMVKNILKKNGYENCNVIEVSDGVEAVEKYREYKPALVFMNIVVPTIDGIAATRAIKEINSEAKVIMLSSANLAMTIADSLIAGAVDYIIKPFSAEKLIEVINKHTSEYIELDTEAAEAWKGEVQSSPDGAAKRIDQYLIDDLIEKFTK